MPQDRSSLHSLNKRHSSLYSWKGTLPNGDALALLRRTLGAPRALGHRDQAYQAIQPSCMASLAAKPSCMASLAAKPSCMASQAAKPSCMASLAAKPSCMALLAAKPSCMASLAAKPSWEAGLPGIRSTLRPSWGRWDSRPRDLRPSEKSRNIFK